MNTKDNSVVFRNPGGTRKHTPVLKRLAYRERSLSVYDTGHDGQEGEANIVETSIIANAKKENMLFFITQNFKR